MNTTTDTPPAQLTPAQRRAALAWIERDGASLRQVAARFHLAADELLDILTQPHVAAFIEAAENIIQLRASILARYDDIEARQSLVEVAKDPEADHATRVRAAITILQGPPPRRIAMPTLGTTSPAGPPLDRSTGAPPTTSPLPANTPPAPAHANTPPAQAQPPTPPTAAHLTRAARAPVAHPAASPAIPARPP